MFTRTTPQLNLIKKAIKVKDISVLSVYCVNNNLYARNKETIMLIAKTENTQDFLIRFDDKHKPFSIWINSVKTADLSLSYNEVRFTNGKTGITFKREELTTGDIYQENKNLEGFEVGGDFLDGLSRVIDAVGLVVNFSNFQTQFLSVNCHYLGENRLELQATDRFRVHTFTCNFTGGEFKDFMISQDVARELIKTKPEKILIRFEKTEKNLSSITEAFIFGDDIMYNNYTEGLYPDVHKFIPTNFRCCFEIEKKHFLEILKRGAEIANKLREVNRSGILKYDKENHALELEIYSYDFNDTSKKDCLFSEQIKIDTDRYCFTENREKYMDNYSQSFNLNYLVDGVKALKDDTITFGLNTNNPILLTNASEQGDKTQKIFASGLK